MSVSCDFYQTCFYNSVSHTYTTIRKFYPHVVDGNKCYSVNSGKRSELKDNNYPYVFRKLPIFNVLWGILCAIFIYALIGFLGKKIKSWFNN